MTEHYFSEKPTSEMKIERITSYLRGERLIFLTAGGVFSPKQVDKGTELLADSAIIHEGWKVLDLGCGYGAVGIAVKKSEPSTEVTFTDINERAVMLTKENLKLNKTEGRAFQGKGFEKIKETFDTILLNPPQTAGKDVCFALIQAARQHLKKDGSLQIVARRNKGGESYSKKMEEEFGNLRVTAKKSGYWIYVSTR